MKNTSLLKEKQKQYDELKKKYTALVNHKEKKEAECIWCDPCQKKLGCKSAYIAHKKTRKHLINEQQIDLSEGNEDSESCKACEKAIEKHGCFCMNHD